MTSQIQVKRGLKVNLPTLNIGEFGFCSDTKEVFIGSASGNVLVTHPAKHLPSIITQDESNRFVTDTEKATWNAKAEVTHTHSMTDVSGTISTEILDGAFPAERLSFFNSTSSTNVRIGYQAGDAYGTITGINNTFLGTGSGHYNAGGGNNTCIGFEAGADNSESYNTFVGSSAGRHNQTGLYNVFLGHDSGYGNVAGNSNTFLGREAGYNNTANANTFVGGLAGYKNTTGMYNVFLGYKSGQKNTMGNSNTFLGYYAGFSNTADNNTFVGRTTGYSNTTGDGNAFLGSKAGYYNTTGLSNTFIGSEAGYSNTSGSTNVFLGDRTGYYNTTGGCNTFIGSSAGCYNKTGKFNTFMGFGAGINNEGDRNIYIGWNALAYSSSSGNIIINSLGSDYGTGSNNIAIGNMEMLTDDDIFYYGNAIKIGHDSGNSVCYINGIYNSETSKSANVYIDDKNRLYRSTSSKRYKRDIEDLESQYSENFLKNARPIWYRSACDSDKPDHSWWGFIAEELEKIDPRLVSFGYHEDDYEIIEVKKVIKHMVPNPDYAEGSELPEEIEEELEQTYEKKVLKKGAVKSPIGVHYDRITVFLTQIVQMQQKEIDEMKIEMKELKETIKKIA